MGRLLIFLSGARPDVLARCPSEMGKFMGLGGAVLTTSSLAAVSLSFVLTSALSVNPAVAVIMGLLWGLVVLSRDRWLVASIAAHGTRRLVFALPRLLLSLLLGIVISTPLVLQIFKPEIDAQVVAIKKARADTFQQQLSRGDDARETARLRQVVTQLQKVIDSGGQKAIDPAKDPKMASLIADRDRVRRQANQYYDNWQCELYGTGCSSTSGAVGSGPRARQLQEKYQSVSHQAEQLNAQIDQRKRELTQISASAAKTRLAQAKADLPGYLAQLDRHLRQQEQLRADFETENRGQAGLLLRLEALEAVSAKNATLNTARLLLFLLLVLIECLPVIAKLMHRPGNYERVLALQDRRELQMARTWLLSAQTHTVQSSGKLTLEEVWQRESREPDQLPKLPETTSSPPHIDPTDEDELQDRALRDMRDARVPPDADTPTLPGRRQ